MEQIVKMRNKDNEGETKRIFDKGKGVMYITMVVQGERTKQSF